MGRVGRRLGRLAAWVAGLGTVVVPGVPGAVAATADAGYAACMAKATSTQAMRVCQKGGLAAADARVAAAYADALGALPPDQQAKLRRISAAVGDVPDQRLPGFLRENDRYGGDRRGRRLYDRPGGRPHQRPPRLHREIARGSLRDVPRRRPTAALAFWRPSDPRRLALAARGARAGPPARCPSESLAKFR